MTTTTATVVEYHPEKHHRFAVMWINPTAPWNREMSRHTFPLRDWLPPSGRENPFETWDIYLDQVHLILNPVDALVEAAADPASGFGWKTGDSADYDYRVETYHLLVRFDPAGQRHLLYAEPATDPTREDGVRSVVVPVQYSGSLFLHPGVDSGDKHNRVYRPVRDLPVAENVAPYQFGESLTVELIWPVLLANASNVPTKIPDYRVLRVMCDFSCRRR